MNKVLLNCNYSTPQIMKHLHLIKLSIVAFVILLNATSCTKEEIDSDKHLVGVSVHLKSTTNNSNKVYLDIQDVQVKVKDDGSLPSAWMSLNTINSGTHNVSDLRADSELLLVDHSEIKSTYIYEIRLVLGENNFMDINQTLVSLDVAEIGNARPSNLVKTELESHHIYEVVINLDIDKSIRFDEDQDMMILNPKLYTEIRKY